MSSFDSFKAQIKGDVVTPSDPDYKEAIARWAATSVRPAKVVAFVKDAEDVALALKYAQAEGLPIAVRGGGHSASAQSSTDGGLVVDLSRHLSGVTIDPEQKLAYIQGGAVWKTVDEAAIKHGLATVGGTVNHTGVGGLTLGGGYGWLSSAHGLALDNLVKVTIVTADGTIRTVSENENPDLFWAVRGAGSNFGVVTEFVSRLHEQAPTVYSGIMIFPPPLFEQFNKALNNWVSKKHSDKEALVFGYTRGPPPDRHPVVAAVPFYNGSVEEGRQNFKEFLDLHPMDQTGEIPYEKMNGLQNDALFHGQCVYIQPIALSNFSLENAKKVFDKMAELSAGPLRITIAHDLFPLEKILSVPKTATAFNTRDENKYNCVVIAMWDDNTPENFEAGRSATKEIADIIAAAEPEGKEAQVRAYGNYEGEGANTSSKAMKIFGENYPRLQQLKKIYDPNSIFSSRLPIIPA